jgi:hypothetical protein
MHARCRAAFLWLSLDMLPAKGVETTRIAGCQANTGRCRLWWYPKLVAGDGDGIAGAARPLLRDTHPGSTSRYCVRLLSGATLHIRQMSSSEKPDESTAATKLPTMESKLRQLYMRVHPDLFALYPEARNENEKSFQLLSEFLAAIKNSDGGGGRARVGKVFKLVFYVRPEGPCEGRGEEEQATAELEQVSVNLRADGSPSEKKFQLLKLFEACGILGDFSYTAAGGSGKGRAAPAATDLELFVRQQSRAAATARQNHERAWRQFYSQQHALQLWHCVRVSFAGTCTTWPPDVRSEVLQHLLSDAVLACLKGLPSANGDSEQEGAHRTRHVLLADSNAIDIDGRLVLDAHNPRSWSRHISMLDWSAVAAAEVRTKEVRALERAAAQRLGMAFVHGATPEIERSAAYSLLLESVCRRCHDTGFAPHVQRRTASDAGREDGGRLMERPVLLVQAAVSDDMEDTIKYFDGCALETRRGLFLGER